MESCEPVLVVGMVNVTLSLKVVAGAPCAGFVFACCRRGGQEGQFSIIAEKSACSVEQWRWQAASA